MLAQGKFPVWDTCEIPLLELSMYLVIVNPSTCRVFKAVTAHQTLKWSPPSFVCIHHPLQLCLLDFKDF